MAADFSSLALSSQMARRERRCSNNMMLVNVWLCLMIMISQQEASISLKRYSLFSVNLSAKTKVAHGDLRHFKFHDFLSIFRRSINLRVFKSIGAQYSWDNNPWLTQTRVGNYYHEKEKRSLKYAQSFIMWCQITKLRDLRAISGEATICRVHVRLANVEIKLFARCFSCEIKLEFSTIRYARNAAFKNNKKRRQLRWWEREREETLNFLSYLSAWPLLFRLGNYFFRLVQDNVVYNYDIWCKQCDDFIFYTAWWSEIGSLTSVDACISCASGDVREPISLHQAV